MIEQQQIAHTEDRRVELSAAIRRLTRRLAFALEGLPAWSPLGDDGEPMIGSHALVPFAPPWCEDPNMLVQQIKRCESVLATGKDYV